uniref:Uncharacterized protein n=1 Tax=Anguilla anguilla TaxID=7936 RepID=A0A0E9X5A4_ANGAN
MDLSCSGSASFSASLCQSGSRSVVVRGYHWVRTKRSFVCLWLRSLQCDHFVDGFEHEV